jgi:uncharacterized protein (TIGR03067 family)
MAITLLVLLAFLGQGMAQDGVKKEIDQLSGRYRLVSVRAGSRMLPEELVTKERIVINGDKFELETPSIKIKLTFMIDPSKNPKQIDFIADDMQLLKCIYELSDNKLRIAKPYGGDRPKDFDGAGDQIEVWERIENK